MRKIQKISVEVLEPAVLRVREQRSDQDSK